MKVRWTLGILVIYTLLFINVDKLIAEKTWTQEPDMPIAKSGHDAIVINGAIYVFGGNSGGGEDPLVTVKVYGAEEIFQSVDPAGKLVKTWGTIKIGDN